MISKWLVIFIFVSISELYSIILIIILYNQYQNLKLKVKWRYWRKGVEKKYWTGRDMGYPYGFITIGISKA